ncbi:MAG: MotA/TolQ/ExbB proton channel family protein [Phycisphaeraceae bacterium]|nr:MAG: MotA/TolQ/ExbB proton channel family protein [Phycisphaeraceae bacterium]
MSLDSLISLFKAGGWVMYPLAVLSVLSVALSFERLLFWARTHGAGHLRTIERITREMRKGDLSAAASVAGRDKSVYGRYAADLLDEAREKNGRTQPVDESFALERAESIRPIIERWSTTQATIITAAPMLGILGTVTGIIRSFNLLSADQVVTDPAMIAGGIAEALFTTAFGLVVALLTIFPHALFRAQAERCLSRLELIAASVNERSRDQKRGAGLESTLEEPALTGHGA